MSLAGLFSEDSPAPLQALASDLRGAARRVATLALQGERYHSDPEYHCAVEVLLQLVAATGRPQEEPKP